MHKTQSKLWSQKKINRIQDNQSKEQSIEKKLKRGHMDEINTSKWWWWGQERMRKRSHMVVQVHSKIIN